jgi:hypothetical protein
MNRFVTLLAVILFFPVFTGYAQDAGSSPGAIEVCYRKTSVLVFPTGIETADFGSPDILVKTVKKGSNVLKVKAAKEVFEPTNLTVFTNDGKLYNLNVSYSGQPRQQVYLYSDSAAVAGATFYPDTLSTGGIALKARFLSKIAHRSIIAKKKNQNLVLLLRQIYVSAGKMYFVFQLYNFSNIPYTMQFVRFFEQDARRQKLTSHSQREMVPVFSANAPGATVHRYQPVTFVAVFNQFTITQHKRFALHIGEAGGDRQQRLVLKGKTILRAKKL